MTRAYILIAAAPFSRAMPQAARAGRVSPRARSGLGHTATIAIAVAVFTLSYFLAAFVSAAGAR